MLRIYLSLFVLAAAAPTSLRAQHFHPRELLERPTDGVALACRVATRRNPGLPSSAHSYEFTYGVLRDPDRPGAPPRLEQHQRFRVIWDSAGQMVAFGVTHDPNEPSESDSLAAGLMLVRTGADSLDGRWFLIGRDPPMQPMTPGEIREALALAAFFWSRRCPDGSSAPRAP